MKYLLFRAVDMVSLCENPAAADKQPCRLPLTTAAAADGATKLLLAPATFLAFDSWSQTSIVVKSHVYNHSFFGAGTTNMVLLRRPTCKMDVSKAVSV